MAIIIGSGEPVSRLRRSLDVKGKVNLSVDEILVPTIEIFDATRPPFRKTGVRWFADITVPAVAAQLGRFRVFHNIVIDQLVDSIILTELTGSGAQQFRVGAGPAGAAGGLAVRTTEIMPLDAGGAISRALPILTLVDSITPTSLSQNFYTVTIGAPGEESMILPVEIVLPAAKPDSPITNAPCLTIETTSSNRPFHVSISGLFWDSLPLDSLT